MKIAVYSPNWVGDATLSLPFIHKLKAQNSESEIIVVCKDWVAPVYHNNPNIDKIISFSSKDLKGLIRTIKNGLGLRDQKFDYFYTLTDSFRSSLVMWLSRAKNRIGYSSQLRTPLLTSAFNLPLLETHRTNKYFNLIGELSDIDYRENYIFLDEVEANWARKKLSKCNISNFIAIFPFSVSHSRTFPKIKIKEWLSDSTKQYVIFGTNSEKKEALKIINQNTGISIHSFCGELTLRNSIALISLANYALAADSGLGHISSIMEVPTVSFFGAKRSKTTKPIGPKNIIIDKSDRCNPCNGNICCLNAITKADVNTAIKKLQNIHN